MSIKIQAKKVIVRGNQMWKITHIKMLKKNQLPVLYTDKAAERIYLHSNSNGVVYLSTLVAKTNINFLMLQSLISDQILQEKLSTIARCGNVLKQINKDLSKINEGWKGDETFTI